MNETLENARGIVICCDENGRIIGGRVFFHVEQARGYRADAVIWFNQPPKSAESTVVYPCLLEKRGAQFTAHPVNPV